MMRMRTTTMKGTLSHPQHRHPLPCLRRSSKKKTPWRIVHNNDLDDLGDLDEDPNEGRSDVEEWFPQDGSNDRD
jgi:hypothetical protein